MKKNYLFVLFSLIALPWFSVLALNQAVSQEAYHYVTVFQFKNLGTDSQQGHVMREKNGSTTFYQAYDEEGHFLGSAEYLNSHSKAYSAQLKLYDLRGNSIGTINGEFWTSLPAKFLIETDDFNGHASLASNKIEFTILNKSLTPMLQLYRHLIEDETDYWEIHSLKGNQVPELITKIFAAFASDTHDQFIKDN